KSRGKHQRSLTWGYSDYMRSLSQIVKQKFMVVELFWLWLICCFNDTLWSGLSSFLQTIWSTTNPYLTSTSFDLVSPALIYFSRNHHISRALVLAVISGIMVEYHSTAPKGLFILTYWFLMLTTLQIKQFLPASAIGQMALYCLGPIFCALILTVAYIVHLNYLPSSSMLDLLSHLWLTVLIQSMITVCLCVLFISVRPPKKANILRH
ncbi:MAG: hypothetical protein OXC40_03985, partial [Proteobacteria bacterium]|nr:hypothetical protein [Pseudomonadota bacterium]